MNKFRDDASQQREDILAWFRSTPGLIFTGVVLLAFTGWLVAQFVIDLVSQVAA